jgi:hypothetical protein
VTGTDEALEAEMSAFELSIYTQQAQPIIANWTLIYAKTRNLK